MDLRINYLPSRPEGFLGGSEGRFDGFILRKTDAWNALRHPFEAGGGPQKFCNVSFYHGVGTSQPFSAVVKSRTC